MKTQFVKFARTRLPGISIAVIRNAWRGKYYVSMIRELRGRDVVSAPNGEIIEHRTDGDRWCWSFGVGRVSIWSCLRREFI